MSNVHLLLDEAAFLGHMDLIDNALGIGRGYGVRLTLIYQSMGQLRTCFPDGQDQTLLSNTSQVFFACNDNVTADYVSTRLGEQTIVLASGGTTKGTSWQATGGVHGQSHGGSGGASSNWAMQARKLLKPEEVVALPPRVAITFTPGVPPVRTWLLRHYEEGPALVRAAGGRRRRGGGLARFRSLLVLPLLEAAAAALTGTFSGRTASTWRPPANTGRGTYPTVHVPGAEHVQEDPPVPLRDPVRHQGRGDGRRAWPGERRR